jgi:site-specific recombinase XerD
MITAREQFSAYLNRRYSDRSTPKHYLNDLDLFIRTIRPKKPQEVTGHDVDAFIDQQLAKGLKPTTINRRLASLHTFFEYLASAEDGEVGLNPVKWLRHRLQEGSYLPRDVADETVDKLFGVIDKSRDRAMFGLMVGAGLRVGEVRQLKCSDLSNPDVTTNSARLRVRGKGQKERIVWVTPRWYAEIAAWLSERKATSCAYLFLNQQQQPLSVSGIQYCLKLHCRQSDTSISCHQLRHTFARRLAEQKMPVESIALLLGHAKVSTTQRYIAGADPNLRDAFLQAMNALEQREFVSSALPLGGSRARRREKRDPQLLQAALTALNCLPTWLQPTVHSYFKRRWRNWKAHTAPKLAAQLQNNLIRHWQWLISVNGLSGWDDLKRSHIEEWMQTRLESGLMPKSVHTEYSLIKGCLLEAIELDITLSPHLFRIKPPKLPALLPRFLPPADSQALQQIVLLETEADTFEAALNRAWFLTLLQTGVRSGELLDLRLGDLDFSHHRLFVNSGKNGDERVVYRTPSLTAALARYLAYRPDSSDDHLWLLADGCQLKAQQVEYRLKKWGKACSVNVSPHRLRHTFATQLVNQGMPLASVAKLLGHRKLDMTQHYARLYEETVKEQFETAAAHIEGIIAVDWPKLTYFEPIAPQILQFT